MRLKWNKEGVNALFVRPVVKLLELSGVEPRLRTDFEQQQIAPAAEEDATRVGTISLRLFPGWLALSCTEYILFTLSKTGREPCQVGTVAANLSAHAAGLRSPCRRWGGAWRVPLSFYTQNVGAGVGHRALSLTTSQTSSPLLTRPLLALSSSFFPRTGLATREGNRTLQGLVFRPSQGKNDSRSYLLNTASRCCFCRLRRLLLIVCACLFCSFCLQAYLLPTGFFFFFSAFSFAIQPLSHLASSFLVVFFITHLVDLVCVCVFAALLCFGLEPNVQVGKGEEWEQPVISQSGRDDCLAHNFVSWPQ
jgi:hypothetical protein